MNFEHLKSHINQLFPDMSPQVQVAARHVLDNVDDVALLSMRQLAKKADVHPTTMVRLAQMLGYEGFNELKEIFVTQMRAAPDDLVGRAKGLQGHKGHVAEMLEEIQFTAQNNISQTIQCAKAQKLEEVADTLLEANNIYVMGLRISYPVAFSFFYAYSMFRSNARLVDGRAGTVADILRGVGKGDVLLAMSVYPFSRETVRAVNYARSRGAKVITVSDSEITPLGGQGNHALVVKNDSPTFFPSNCASMALMESLIAIMIAKGGDELLDEVAQSKAQLDEFDAYWEVQTE